LAPYAQALAESLARYKVRRLGIEEDGRYVRSGRTYPHILPEHLRFLNLLEAIRAEFIDYLHQESTHIRLHRDFHHLNSSQALAFNLFFPYLRDTQGAALISSAVGVQRDVAAWDFEHVPDAEEGTNVDVAWASPEGGWTFCEVKLTETSFGTSRSDDRHRQKLTNIYLPRLRHLVDDSFLNADVFFEHYQILRNVALLHDHPEHRVVFLLPQANSALHPPLSKVLSCLKPLARNRISVTYLETLLETLAQKSVSNGLLQSYPHQLREKYIPAGTLTVRS
jgi:hypothetical protein